MQPSTIATARRHQSGVSLVESLIVLSIAAVLAGTTVPGFMGALERRQLEGSAAQLETDLQLARSAAVAANRSVRISFGQDATGSCYVVHSGGAGACSCSANAAPVCASGATALRSVGFPATGAVQLQANVAAMLFDADKGTVSPTGTLRLRAGGGQALNVVVNIMGRVRQCTPDVPMIGQRAC